MTKLYKFADQIWLFSQNIRITCLTKMLDHKYHSFFTIKKYIGSYAYKLELPCIFNNNIYDDFHIFFLLVKVKNKEYTKIKEILDSKMHYGII